MSNLRCVVIPIHEGLGQLEPVQKIAVPSATHLLRTDVCALPVKPIEAQERAKRRFTRDPLDAAITPDFRRQ